MYHVKSEQIHESYKTDDTFELTIEGKTVRFVYETKYLLPGHLNVYGEISTTGYKSHFFYMEKYHIETPLREYARMLGEELIEESREHFETLKMEKLKEAQMSLF